MESQKYEEIKENKVYNCLDFDEKDLVEVEITSHVNNFLVEDAIYIDGKETKFKSDSPKISPIFLKRGTKHVVQMVGRDFIKLVESGYVASKEDVQNLKAIKMQTARERENHIKNYMKINNRDHDLTEKDLELEKILWQKKNNVFAKFFSTYDYAYPPLEPIKMLNNKGLYTSDLEAKQMKESNIYNSIIEIANKQNTTVSDSSLLAEALKQNAELMKMILEMKGVTSAPTTKQESPATNKPVKKGPFGRPIKEDPSNET